MRLTRVKGVSFPDISAIVREFDTNNVPAGLVPAPALCHKAVMHPLLARWFLRKPLLYEAGIVANMLRKPWHVRSDPFFRILQRFPTRSIALDVGANRGQSALTIAALRPDFEIWSFEPNTSCAIGLGAVQMRLGARWHTLFEGLGDEDRLVPFFEPCLHGFPLSTEGTFNRDNLHQSAQDRMRASFRLSPSKFHAAYDVRERFFRTTRLDGLGLTADFIKLDTQGFEANCIAGGRDTIDRCSPVIVAENNLVQFEAMSEIMSDLSYRPFGYCRKGNCLSPADEETHRTLGDVFWLRETPFHRELTHPEGL